MPVSRDPGDPLARRTSEGVARVLRAEIFSGALKAGDPLRERALAERLQVSRTPVREALFILQSEGLVDLSPNRGATVRTLSTDDLLEIYRIRCLLEAHAAELAAEGATPEQIDAMEDAQIRLARMHRRGTAADQASADLAFHVAVLKASRSSLLESLLHQVLAFTVSFRASYATAMLRTEQALVDHEAILDAIRDKDPERASRLMREHVESSGRYARAEFLAAQHRESTAAGDGGGTPPA